MIDFADPRPMPATAVTPDPSAATPVAPGATSAAADARPALALFGGAFDPPHVGHVLAAQYVLLTSAVQRVLVVPCARHPFAKNHPTQGDASFEHRLAMCRLAFAGGAPQVQVLDLEAQRPGPSYTIDTVRDLMRLYPGWAIEVVIGSDNFAEFDHWKDADSLRTLARLRVLPRLEEPSPATGNGGGSGVAEGSAASGGAAEGEGMRFFCLPRVSSTTVRALLAAGADASALVPREVLAYIAAHGLYGQGRQG